MVSAGGRALLALNRTLFRGPKYLESSIGALDRKPYDYYHHLARQLVTRPSEESAAAYMQALETFHSWPLDRTASLSVFVRDNELAWLTGVLPPEAS